MEHIIAKLLQDFEQGKMNRRQLIQSLAMAATAASAAAPALAAESPFKAVAVNHISYQVKDYKVTRDFYADLFGMRLSRMMAAANATWRSAIRSCYRATDGRTERIRLPMSITLRTRSRSGISKARARNSTNADSSRRQDTDDSFQSKIRTASICRSAAKACTRDPGFRRCISRH